MAMQTTGRSARMEQAVRPMATEAYGAAGRRRRDRSPPPASSTSSALLVLLALLTGAVGYADGVDRPARRSASSSASSRRLIGIFRPAAAQVAAPLYALAEGLALGALTALYATGSSGVAPLAIIFTAGVFIGALVVFRSGLVKVTPRFVSMTIMAGFGFLLALIAGMLGLFPGLSGQTGLLVFGVIGVGDRRDVPVHRLQLRRRSASSAACRSRPSGSPRSCS